jgi:hypothetical protein
MSFVDIFFPDAEPPATIESYNSPLTPVPEIPDPEAYDKRLEKILEQGAAIASSQPQPHGA